MLKSIKAARRPSQEERVSVATSPPTDATMATLNALGAAVSNLSVQVGDQNADGDPPPPPPPPPTPEPEPEPTPEPTPEPAPEPPPEPTV